VGDRRHHDVAVRVRVAVQDREDPLTAVDDERFVVVLPERLAEDAARRFLGHEIAQTPRSEEGLHPPPADPKVTG
jgi:hypothetical protein